LGAWWDFGDWYGLFYGFLGAWYALLGLGIGLSLFGGLVGFLGLGMGCSMGFWGLGMPFWGLVVRIIQYALLGLGIKKIIFNSYLKRKTPKRLFFKKTPKSIKTSPKMEFCYHFKIKNYTLKIFVVIKSYLWF
jgi:hypothetical protein